MRSVRDLGAGRSRESSIVDSFEEFRAAKRPLVHGSKHFTRMVAGSRERPNVSRQTRVRGISLIRDVEAAPRAGDQVLL